MVADPDTLYPETETPRHRLVEYPTLTAGQAGHCLRLLAGVVGAVKGSIDRNLASVIPSRRPTAEV